MKTGTIGGRQIKVCFTQKDQLIFFSDTDEKVPSKEELIMFDHFNYILLPIIRSREAKIPVLRLSYRYTIREKERRLNNFIWLQ